MENLPKTLSASPRLSPQPVSPPPSITLHQPPDTSQPVSPPPPKKTSKSPSISKWVLITLIAFSVMLLSLGGWWLYNQYLATPNQTQTETDRPFNLPTQQPAKPSDWTQYTSQKCRYQISYPSSWYIYTQAEEEETGAILIASNQVQGEIAAINEVRVQIGCSAVDPNITIQTAINNLKARYQEQSITLSQTKTTTIAGKTAYYHTLTPNLGNPSKEYYIFPTTSRIVIINIIPANSNQLETAKSVLQTLTFSN